MDNETAVATNGKLSRELFESTGVPTSWEPPHEPAGTDLDHIAARINTAIAAGEDMTRNALRFYLNAGADLIAAKERMPNDERETWGTWLERNCPRVGMRTAQIYMQLARRRDDIEYELKRNPDLSLRVARRLVMNSRKNQRLRAKRRQGANPEDSEIPDWVLAWRQASNEDKTVGSDHIPIGEWLDHMPASKVAELEARVLGIAAARAPTRGQQNAIKRAIRKPVTIEGAAIHID
jgi:hypothetical protein